MAFTSQLGITASTLGAQLVLGVDGDGTEAAADTAAHRPLVIIDGLIQRLPADSTLGNENANVIPLTNSSGVTVVRGQPVYSSTGNEVSLAKADSVNTSRVVGFVFDASVDDTDTVRVITFGVLTATTTEWDAVADGGGGLVPNAEYFLDPDTAGKITLTAPSTGGDLVAPVGRAFNATQLLILIRATVLLA